MHPILQNDKHPDRKLIEPSVEDALKLRTRGEIFAWRLSEELLARIMPTATEANVRHSAPSTKLSSNHNDTELLAMLRRELDIKNQQITQQNELIAQQMGLLTGLSERLREGNILLGSLQRQFALPDGRGGEAVDSAKTKRPRAAAPSEKLPSTSKATKVKRGFLARLFH